MAKPGARAVIITVRLRTVVMDVSIARPQCVGIVQRIAGVLGIIADAHPIVMKRRVIGVVKSPPTIVTLFRSCKLSQKNGSLLFRASVLYEPWTIKQECYGRLVIFALTETLRTLGHCFLCFSCLFFRV